MRVGVWQPAHLAQREGLNVILDDGLEQLHVPVRVGVRVRVRVRVESTKALSSCTYCVLPRRSSRPGPSIVRRCTCLG